MKLYGTCPTCHELMLVTGHPSAPHPTCPAPVDYLARLQDEFLAAVEAGDDAKADALAETLDRADQAPQSLAGAALWYALRGWPVFPLKPGDKIPLTPKDKGGNGFRDATTDARVVQDWWSASPGSNIGVPTGLRFDVIDVDYRSHPNALQAWATIRDDFTVHGMVSTPRGMHYYVMPTGDESGVGPGGIAGLDYRGIGGYVVVPPSRRPDGRYFWWSPPSPLI